ncbi:MAG: iron ABC transporter permease [Caldilinea sp.]|nr:iron ABC transporter permease [Caldilinea sp.]MDW8440501.1 iron ABC transporter permease [Caldilineaceae bacterium]
MTETLQTSSTTTDFRSTYQRAGQGKRAILLLLSILLGAAILYAVSVGTVSISLSEILTILRRQFFSETAGQYELNHYIIWQIRLPRIAAAVITGMALAMGGVIMQAIFRNPLASPYTLGVSSGAAFGAALAIVLGTSLFGVKLAQSGQTLIAVNAFLFGCLSLAFVYAVAQIKGGSTIVLLLAGVALSSLFGAGVSALSYFSNNEALRNLTVWLMGGFWGANWSALAILSPITLLALLILMFHAWELNAISSGEEVAETLGVHVKRTHLVTLVTVTLAASAAIAFSGIIGFIGLVAPHITRSFVGADNRYLIPGSALMGGLMLLAADTLARTIIAPTEVPVGIITALFGAPFFLYILVTREQSMWS